MLLDKIETIQGRKSDEIYPFSNCIFWPNFVKGTGVTYRKTLMSYVASKMAAKLS
jgi:hypothetical protein